MRSPRDTLIDRKNSKKTLSLKKIAYAESLVLIDPDIAEDAEALITKRLDLGHRDISVRELAAVFMNRAPELIVKGREDHIKALAEAYATYVFLKVAPDFSSSIAELAVTLGVKISPTTDPLKIILQSRIFYSNVEGKNSASKLYSRDVQAIRHLIERRIKPSEVVPISKKPGEGLDNWSRKSTSKASSSRYCKIKKRIISMDLDDENSLHTMRLKIGGEVIETTVGHEDKYLMLSIIKLISGHHENMAIKKGKTNKVD